jgi:hypothetical protein
VAGEDSFACGGILMVTVVMCLLVIVVVVGGIGELLWRQRHLHPYEDEVICYGEIVATVMVLVFLSVTVVVAHRQLYKNGLFQRGNHYWVVFDEALASATKR